MPARLHASLAVHLLPGPHLESSATVPATLHGLGKAALALARHNPVRRHDRMLQVNRAGGKRCSATKPDAMPRQSNPGARHSNAPNNVTTLPVSNRRGHQRSGERRPPPNRATTTLARKAGSVTPSAPSPQTGTARPRISAARSANAARANGTYITRQRYCGRDTVGAASAANCGLRNAALCTKSWLKPLPQSRFNTLDEISPL